MPEIPHKRRVRYRGKNPRFFEEKYKEHEGDTATLQKVMAGGKTPAGAHRPIMVREILAALHPQPGERFVDCTLGFGGHAERILPLLRPGGTLLALDVDPLECPKTETRLRSAGFDQDVLVVRQSNYAGMGKIIAELGWPGVDGVLADLGLSSMQIDDPKRGFSVKMDGPLDMRMNPLRGHSASQFLETVDAASLETILRENSDEPESEMLSRLLAGRKFESTNQLRRAIEAGHPKRRNADQEQTIRRVFQAIRIAVNDELSALDAFLRILPHCLNPGGRVAILTFHSGEDRRVKKAFKSYLEAGLFSEISDGVIRATPEERHDNPRSASAKLRWAVGSGQ